MTRSAVWVTVALISGMLVAPLIPPVAVGPVALVAAAGGWWALRIRRGAWVVVLLAAGALGVLRGARPPVWSARPPEAARMAVVDGCLLRVDHVGEGERWILRRSRGRLRVYSDTGGARPADRVRVAVRLRRLEGRWQGHVQAVAVVGTSSCGGPLTRLQRSRQRFVELLRRRLGSESGGIAAALVAGDRGAVSEQARQAYQTTGSVHVLVVSGLHLSILMALLFALMRVLLSVPVATRPVAGVVAACVAGAGAVVYAAYVGAGVPVQRAWVLGVIGLWAVGSTRGRRSLSPLAAAAALLAWVRPESLGEPGFQLSFAAVAGILLATRTPLGLRGLRRRVVEGVRITAGASAATAPIVAWHFGRVPLLGLVANGAVLPLLAGCAVPALFLVAVVHAIHPELASFLLPVPGHAIEWATTSVRWCAGLPVSSVRWSPGLAGLAGAGLLMVAFTQRHSLRRAALIAAAAASLLVADARVGPGTGRLEVAFLPVGHGDATVIITPHGRALVVDGGGRAAAPLSDVSRSAAWPGYAVVVPYLRRAGVRNIDAVVLTHAHPDHLHGLRAVTESFPTRELWVAGPLSDAASFSRLESSVERVQMVGRGQVREIDGVRIEVLHPVAEPSRGWAPDLNNRSIVMRLSWRGRTVLLTGDIEAEAEQVLLGRVEAEVVKVPHHGSRTSSTPAFVEAVDAEHAVVSGGPSPWPLPDAGVLTRWQHSGARLYRTDCNGTIRFSTAGERWRVRADKKCLERL